MSFLRLLFVLLLSTLAVHAARELSEGLTRAEFEALAGKPVSVLKRGSTTVLIYPRKGRAEFVDGKCTYFERIEALDTPPESEPPPAPSASAPAGSPPPASSPAAAAKAPAANSSPSAAKPSPSASSAAPAPAPTAAKPAKPASAAPQASVSAAPAPATREQQEVEEYGRVLTPEERKAIAAHEAEAAMAQEKFLDSGTLVEDSEAEQQLPGGEWLVLAIKAFLSLPIMVVALRFSFKWNDVDADWKDMWLPALADTFTWTAVQALAYGLWHVTEVFRVDDCIAFLVLAFVLTKTTHASSALRSIRIAFFAKGVSLLLRYILALLAMGIVFRLMVGR